MIARLILCYSPLILQMNAIFRDENLNNLTISDFTSVCSYFRVSVHHTLAFHHVRSSIGLVGSHYCWLSDPCIHGYINKHENPANCTLTSRLDMVVFKQSWYNAPFPILYVLYLVKSNCFNLNILSEAFQITSCRNA